MGFPRQDYWSGLPISSPVVFLAQGSNLNLLHWQADSFHSEPSGKPAFLRESCLIGYPLVVEGEGENRAVRMPGSPVRCAHGGAGLRRE